MGISYKHATPMIITYILQGTICDMGIPRTLYGGKICRVLELQNLMKSNEILSSVYVT